MMEAAPLLQREVSCFNCIIGIQYLICVGECLFSTLLHCSESNMAGQSTR